MMSENELKDGARQTLPPVERHPFTPFLPEGCRLLMLGSFPPGEKRWTMHFYYPNFTNDMWRIFGICFFQDKMRFVSQEHKTFFLDDIKSFLTRQRIGMYDTATAVRRLKNTASDKDLMVVEPTDLKAMVSGLPLLTDIVTTGRTRAAPVEDAKQLKGLPDGCGEEGGVLSEDVRQYIHTVNLY